MYLWGPSNFRKLIPEVLYNIIDYDYNDLCKYAPPYTSHDSLISSCTWYVFLNVFLDKKNEGAANQQTQNNPVIK